MSGVSFVRELNFPDTTPWKKSPVMDRCADIKIVAEPGRAATAVLFCGRPKDHSGRHAMGDGEIVVAVWA